MQLVPYAKEWKRLWSIRFNILTAALGSAALAYSQLPEDWKASVPPWLISTSATLTIFCAAASAVSAVIDQPKLGQSNDTPK